MEAVPVRTWRLLGVVVCLFPAGQSFAAELKGPTPAAAEMDRDLMEVTIPQLQRYYAQRKYTVTQVVDWYLDRIGRYNGVYRAMEQVFADDARATAAQEDAHAVVPVNAGVEANTPGASDASNTIAARRGPLWGIPIVIKANTSIAGKVTSDGWK